jgi:hypothetical protein
MRDPRVEALLTASTPAVVDDQQWARPMRLAAHLGEHALPMDLVTSVRVMVQVDEQLVVCTNVRGDVEVLPGGRCEPGETWSETGCREVHEETGWIVDPGSLTPLGFLHLENLGEPQPPFPYPDALMPVLVGRGIELAGDDWTDVEGWVVSSTLMPIDELEAGAVDPIGWVFVEHLRRRLGL